MCLILFISKLNDIKNMQNINHDNHALYWIWLCWILSNRDALKSKMKADWIDWIVEVDGDGNIVWVGENVILGEADYDLGWPWGSVTVQITEGTINANLEISTVENPCYEDVDGNGVVNVSDLLALIGNWGLCPDCTGEIPGDVNFDDVVNVTDLLLIVGAWGPCP